MEQSRGRAKRVGKQAWRLDGAAVAWPCDLLASELLTEVRQPQTPGPAQRVTSEDALTSSLSSSWTKKASPLSPSFMCRSTGSPLISMSTCNGAWWSGVPAVVLHSHLLSTGLQAGPGTQAACCPNALHFLDLSLPSPPWGAPDPHSEGICSPSQYSCSCLGFCVPVSPTAHQHKNMIFFFLTFWPPHVACGIFVP